MSNAQPKFQHENFFINNDDQPKKKKTILRQDRFFPESDNEFTLEIDGKLFSVYNYSSFGVAIITDNEWEINKDFYESSIYFNKIEVANVHLKVVRNQNIDDKSNIVAFEINGEPLEVEVVDAMKECFEFTKEYSEKLSIEQDVPVNIKNKVYEFKDFLTSIRDRLDELEESVRTSNRKKNDLIERGVAQVMVDYLNATFEKEYDNFNNMLSEVNEDLKRVCVKFLRRKLENLIYKAPFSHRSYYKPQGYAGDYEMMNLIYSNDLVGDTLFAKCLHKFFVEKPSAQAVRNRRVFLHKQISEVFDKIDEPSIMSVACGPAYEVETYIKDHPSKKGTFYLLDQDRSALKFAQKNIIAAKKLVNSEMKTEFVNLAIKNVINEGIGENKFDIIYSAGLFDYFSDPVAQMAAKRLVDGVRPGGRVIIGNFDISNPTIPMMETILDWKLIYRSADDLKKLFGTLGVKVEVEKEASGINLFCTLEK